MKTKPNQTNKNNNPYSPKSYFSCDIYTHICVIFSVLVFCVCSLLNRYLSVCLYLYLIVGPCYVATFSKVSLRLLAVVVFFFVLLLFIPLIYSYTPYRCVTSAIVSSLVLDIYVCVRLFAFLFCAQLYLCFCFCFDKNKKLKI